MYFPLKAHGRYSHPRGMACMDPRGTVRRTTIYCYTRNTKALGLVASEEEIFLFFFFPFVSLWELTTTGVGPFLTPEAWLPGFMKRTTIHCYIQNMKALCLVVSEFYVFPMTPPGSGLYVSQGHGWQDL